MSGPYDDIINLPRPTSSGHPRMPICDRAFIFSPFAALAGHGAAIVGTVRRTEQRMELDEDATAELDRRQAVLLEHLNEQPEITVTWFRPDERKEGGAYRTAISSRCSYIVDYRREHSVSIAVLPFAARSN